MINFLAKISQENVDSLVEYLNNNYADNLGTDVSNYAKGRRRSWLQYEGPLSDERSFEPGIQDERIWNYVTKLCSKFDWEPELGLISRGGKITRHRDAAYADFRSIGINLGKVTWCYERIYPMYAWVPSEQTLNPTEISKIEMTGGEVFEFNCKNPHWTENVDPDRWGINLWRVSRKKRSEFETFKLN